MVNKQKSQELFEKPNAPLITWAVLLIVSKALSHTNLQNSALHRIVDLVSFGAVFTWAWLELFQGNNRLRRLLGLIVLTVIIASRI